MLDLFPSATWFNTLPSSWQLYLPFLKKHAYVALVFEFYLNRNIFISHLLLNLLCFNAENSMPFVGESWCHPHLQKGVELDWLYTVPSSHFRLLATTQIFFPPDDVSLICFFKSPNGVFIVTVSWIHPPGCWLSSSLSFHPFQH